MLSAVVLRSAVTPAPALAVRTRQSFDGIEVVEFLNGRQAIWRRPRTRRLNAHGQRECTIATARRMSPLAMEGHLAGMNERLVRQPERLKGLAVLFDVAKTLELVLTESRLHRAQRASAAKCYRRRSSRQCGWLDASTRAHVASRRHRVSFTRQRDLRGQLWQIQLHWRGR